MRRLAWLVLAGLLLPGAAAAERIREFHADLRLEADGAFVVEERIVYDFEAAARHGIYRDIPVRYGRGLAADYRIEVDEIRATDAAGSERPLRVERQGRDLRIRIGRADRTVTGVHEYRIRYRVRRGILWLAGHDELYWNVTGTGWRVPIDAADASVSLPATASDEALRVACFTGPQGAVESACGSETRGNLAVFAARRPLGPGEGLTLVLGLPKGLLREPSAREQALARASDWLGRPALVPLAVLLLATGAWWRLGRDPAGAVAIPVRYEPPEGMTPAEMGTVVDERVDMRDVSATILDLAVRGHLAIEEIETTKFLFLSDRDYVLHARKPADESLKLHERRLLDGLFGGAPNVRLSSLKDEFYTRLPGIQDALYDEVSREGKWFPWRPDKVRSRYLALSIGLGILGFAVSVIVWDDAASAAAYAASGAIAAWVSRHMPRKTNRGRRARQHILGFQEFLERVEADRLERLGIHRVSEFERLLPYAFVLGAADAWAHAFADLYTEPPAWFHAAGDGSFDAGRFVSSVGRSLETAGQTLASRPSRAGAGSSGFGGGGFSGGGFGGGGGGSW